MAAQHRERQRADKGGPADQVTSLHQEQHPWHMSRDKGKRANTQRDAPQKKDKREGTIRHLQHTLAAADFRRDSLHNSVLNSQSWLVFIGRGGSCLSGQDQDARQLVHAHGSSSTKHLVQQWLTIYEGMARPELNYCTSRPHVPQCCQHPAAPQAQDVSHSKNQGQSDVPQGLSKTKTGHTSRRGCTGSRGKEEGFESSKEGSFQET
eukprot:1147489-Pelagomonas_calceolata.AAC.4